MRLSSFIIARQEQILNDWDAFAETLMPMTAGMNRSVIRDYAADMLAAIANDLAQEQTPSQQVAKSKGNAPVVTGAPETAAQTHALLRAQSGFDINQMAAEYRALRASVLRLWAAEFIPSSTDLQDTIRFNEAIDQSLAESIAFFTSELDRSRNLLLGMLGHDMRNPLAVVVLTARHLSQLNAGASVSRAASRLISSGARLQALLDDLVDFNRTNLGLGIKISPTPVNLEEVFGEQLELLRAANPRCRLDFDFAGDLHGLWDANRLHQVLGNLVTNALKYGDKSRPIRVSLKGVETQVAFTVTNEGTPIPPELLEVIFEPLKQGIGKEAAASPDGSLGLGLYITREVIRAHHGEIAVNSTAERTVFSIMLPRDASWTPLSGSTFGRPRSSGGLTA